MLAASGQTTPFGWQGQSGAYTDSETGLVLLTFRYYAPALGRFISRDPSGFAGGMNLYGYCTGDPVNVCDASGLDAPNPVMRGLNRGLGAVAAAPGQAFHFLLRGANAGLTMSPNAVTFRNHFNDGSCEAAMVYSRFDDVGTRMSNGIDEIGGNILVNIVAGATGVGEAGAAITAEEDSFELALGMNRNRAGFRSLVPQAKDWEQLGLRQGPNFPDEIRQAMDNASKIHFNTQNMNMTKEILTEPMDEFLHQPGSTNWELRTVYDNLDLKSKTILYRNWKPIEWSKLLR